MKIGIPKALLYYYYFPFWKTFFESLNFEVIISDDTNSCIIDNGSRITVSELCVPIKIFNGHVLNLLNEKHVDFVFVPQFYNHGKEWYCPKFLGITELAESSVTGLSDKILNVKITSKDDMIDSLEDYMCLRNRLNISVKQLKIALKAAAAEQKKFRKFCADGHLATDYFALMNGIKPEPYCQSKITVALLGYVYNIYDKYVSMDAIKKLRAMDVNVVTFDMLDERLIEKNTNYQKEPYWVFARKIYNSCRYLLNTLKIDGVIHMTAFGCGPDSIIGKLMEIDCESAQKPFMTVRLDEHTGDNHIQTRLEAYVDMLKMQKQ